MENNLGKDLEGFFWRYTLKYGIFVKQGRTYANLKSELEAKTDKTAENELKKFCEYSEYYKKIIEPSSENIIELRKRFERHNQWEIRTAYPLLLNLYKEYANGRSEVKESKITTQEFCEILDIIESFVIRRFFSGYKTNKLNQLFIRLYSRLDSNDWVNSLKYELKNDFPNDEEFAEGIKFYKIYQSGQRKCSLILETLEDSYGHKESLKPDNLQIEHILPQSGGDSENLPDEWKEMMGIDYGKNYNKFIDTIGNLTLTGYNAELGQKNFTKKKEIYLKSHIELNKYFESIEKWDEEEIVKRVNLLAKKAIKIWKNIE